MFNAFSEANKSEIQLKGVKANGIALLLEYAYTSKLELNVNNLQDVLAASTHVQMNAVTEACAKFLEARIDVDNFVAIASLADFYSLGLLKKRVYRFICSQLAELCVLPEFMNLSCEQFEYILSTNYPVDCREIRVLDITLQFCCAKLLDAQAIHRFFKHIHWGQITKGDYIESLPHYEDTIEFNDNDLYKKMIFGELKEQKHKHFKHLYGTLQKVMDSLVSQVYISSDDDDDKSSEADSDTDDILTPDVLINSRGMELALVKIGGFETNGLTNNISYFLPSKGKWQHLTMIPHIEQSNYGIAVLCNKLYVVGGSYDVCLREYIHPYGFSYCPTKNKWTTIAPIQMERCRFSLNAMGEKYLYAVGGVNELSDFGESEFNASDLCTCERYNAVTDSWENLTPLPENRSQHAGVVVDDKLYISGGIKRHTVLSTLWCLDSRTLKWRMLCPMLTPRADHSLVVLGRFIYACGGWYEDPVSEMRVLANTIDVYDIELNEWNSEVFNPMPMFYTGVAAVRRRIYFIGGLLSNATANRTTSIVHCYDVDSQKWIRFKEWEYLQEVWESSCAALYIPLEFGENNCK